MVEQNPGCTYRDHSHITDDDKDLNLLLDRADAEGVKGTDQTFPVKLHQLLSGSDEDGFSHIVSWQPHGRSFIVKKHNEFVEKVLPCCFRQTKFASFQRQLNLYGFRRITQGRDKGGYYHELFLRGRTLLALKMQRTKVKGTGARKASSPETEPDFYQMPFVYEKDGKKNDAVSAAPATKAAAAPVPPAAAAPASPSSFAEASPNLQGRSPTSGLTSDLLKMSPPSFPTHKPFNDTLASSAIYGGLNATGAAFPSALAGFGARQELVAQMMASNSRLQSLRDANHLALLNSNGLGAFSSSSLRPAGTGPLHLNAINMPCNCSMPAF